MSKVLSPAVLLIAALLALLVSLPANFSGDVDEYTLTTIALARHGSPDIRKADIAEARTHLPAFNYAFDELEQGWAVPEGSPKPGFYRGKDGAIYAIHFFAYPALAAPFYLVLDVAGVNPLQCFKLVNVLMMGVLALALLQWFGRTWRAAGMFLLVLGCGGVLYLPWSSPETVSAAALLSALLLFTNGRPLLGGALGGLAAMQNPTIIFFAGFAPMFLLALDQGAPAGLSARLRRCATLPVIGGVALCVAVAALPVLFNLHTFGTPSLIAKIATVPEFASTARLHSFFFDLTQGMLPGVFGLALAVVAALMLLRSAATLLTAALVVLFMLALALPALTVGNWNSGAAGMMRYAYWCAMPLAYLLCVCLRQLDARRAAVLLAVALACQLASFLNARRHGHITFSPLADYVLRHMPALYDPEHEIFIERSRNKEEGIDVGQVYRYPSTGVATKTMYHESLVERDARICGDGRHLAPGNDISRIERGWRYLNGAPRCAPGDALLIHLALEDMRGGALKLEQGWSSPQEDGGNWNGVWSDGPQSQLTVPLAPGQQVQLVNLKGHALERGMSTEVTINGQRFAARDLEQSAEFELATPATGAVVIVLRHRSAKSPGPQDGRKLAWFLNGLLLR